MPNRGPQRLVPPETAAVGLPPGLAEDLPREVVEGAVHGAVDADQEVGEADTEVYGRREVAPASIARWVAPQNLEQV